LAWQQENMPTAISICDVTKLMGRRLALPVLVLVGFLMICMAGYVWLEGGALGGQAVLAHPFVCITA